MAHTFASSSSPIPIPIPNPAFFSSFLSHSHSQPSFSLRTTLPSTSLCLLPSKNPTIFRVIPQRRSNKFSTIRAAPEDVVPLESTTAAETAQDVVSTTSDEGVSTVIQALLFAAFIGLSILTIGVIYLGVTDFLQKREKEKFEKEEAANSGKKKKKKKVRARAGPKGFGQKIDEDEDDD